MRLYKWRDWHRDEVTSPILEALGDSKNIIRPALNYDILLTVFAAVLKAVRANPTSKSVLKERAATIDSIDQLTALANQIQAGV